MAGTFAQLNAARHGTHISRLTLGMLPNSMRRQTAAARKYRRELEAVVCEAKGEVDITDAHLIDEAAAAEVHASVCRWLLREKLDEMSPTDIARCSQQILKAKVARNRAFERLGLADVESNVIEALYADRDTPSAAAESGQGDSAASETSVESEPAEAISRGGGES